ncbi:hypothetical protein [Limoniibacter endophyticus]|uniref:Uncharacterized protein n=1 Tax=Limoniibacter endophyticus TaxID=1565040 RepID=A0A8J3GIS1_9HYPH|nr:hypothetical protein [Limoniibacter endophyticus]GHC79342.1 hypothetical protein GCM10010136_31810 [Limoniibacter endophyticus]
MATVIELPAIRGWQAVDFDPIQPRNVDRMEGRRTEVQIYGTHYWVAQYTPGWLDERDFGKMDAFMMRAGDGLEVFRAYDPFRMRPIAWSEANGNRPLSGARAGGGAFDGTATITSRSANSLIVSGLPALFQFRAGDYVEVRQSASVVSLHRILVDVAASTAGIVTLSIRHNLDIGVFTLPLVANFEKPSCLMQIDPGSYSARKSWSDRSPSFSAQEVFFS